MSWHPQYRRLGRLQNIREFQFEALPHLVTLQDGNSIRASRECAMTGLQRLCEPWLRAWGKAMPKPRISLLRSHSRPASGASPTRSPPATRRWGSRHQHQPQGRPAPCRQQLLMVRACPLPIQRAERARCERLADGGRSSRPCQGLWHQLRCAVPPGAPAHSACLQPCPCAVRLGASDACTPALPSRCPPLQAPPCCPASRHSRLPPFSRPPCRCGAWRCSSWAAWWPPRRSRLRRAWTC